MTDGGYGLTGFDELLDEGYGVLVDAEVVGVDLAAGQDEGVVVGGFDFVDEMVDFDGLAPVGEVPALDLAFFMEMTSTVAPAFSRFFFGSVSSTCS